MKDTLGKEGYLSEAELTRLLKYIALSEDGCWLWQGHKDKDGYGIFLLRRKNRRAHRVTWFAVNGVVGDAFVIDHLCKVPSCVNPAHLRRVTPSQNALENSNSVAALNRARTHCKEGHPFDRKYGKQRYCSICHAEKAKRLREKWAKEPLLLGV